MFQFNNVQLVHKKKNMKANRFEKFQFNNVQLVLRLSKNHLGFILVSIQ